jgi:hypothetical protein
VNVVDSPGASEIAAGVTETWWRPKPVAVEEKYICPRADVGDGAGHGPGARSRTDGVLSAVASRSPSSQAR